MWCLVAMALAASGPDPAQLDEVSRRAPPVNWTIVLDSSAEMLPTANAARADIAVLAGALPPGDAIEILAYHARAATVLPRTVVVEDQRAALIEQIKAVQLPTAVDGDLGAGIEAIGEALRAAPEGAGNEVLVLSRFCHAPSVNSRFDTGVRGCRPIRGQSGLAAELGKTLDTHDTVVRLFPVSSTGGPPDAAGVNAAKQALRGDVMTEAIFSEWLKEMVPTVPLERLRPVLAADLRRAQVRATVTSPGTPEEPVVHVKVEAPLRLARLQLVDPQVAGGKRTARGDVLLDPAADLEIEVKPPDVPFALFRQSDVVRYDLKLTAAVLLEPAEILTALDLPKTKEPLASALQVDMPRTYGLPSPFGILILLGGALAGVGGAFAWRTRSILHELGGTFHWRVGGGPRTELEIAHLSSVALVIEGDQLVPGPAERAALVLRMSGPRWRAHAEVEVRRDGVEMNRKALAKGVHPVTPGAASFQFDNFRLTWE